MTAPDPAAVEALAGVHQIHGEQCLCGFRSAVARDRSRHIIDTALAGIARGEVPGVALAADRAGVRCEQCDADDLACSACGALGTLIADHQSGIPREAIEALRDGMARHAERGFYMGDDRPQSHVAVTYVVGALDSLLAAHPATDQPEALEACREQRADLLELIEVERGEHAEALRKAWHEGYGAGSSDATDGWLKPGSPRTPNPYSATDQPGVDCV